MYRAFGRLLKEGKRGLTPLACQSSDALRASGHALSNAGSIRGLAAMPQPISSEDDEELPLANLPSDGGQRDS